jgi:predicted GNAT family N-acyltransferase
MEVHATRVDWSRYQTELRAIRERVFIEEQGVPRSLEWDGQDEAAEHFIALNEAGQALGTARLLRTGQIGRMAVLREHRDRGIGRKLLNAAVRHATSVGLSRVFLHAQRSAEEFYRRSGFQPSGDEFLEANIPHIEMTLDLPIPFVASEPSSGKEIANRDVGSAEMRPSQMIAFDSESGCRAAVDLVLTSARRTAVLLSPFLDPALFASDQCLATVSNFGRRSRHTSVHILVEDTRAIAANNHPLLELARRLPSKILIRRLPDGREPMKRSFLVVDSEAVWLQPEYDAYVGWANLHHRVEARRLHDDFTWLFERSTEDPELRLLSL